MFVKAEDLIVKTSDNACGGEGTMIAKHLTDKAGLYNHGRMFAHVILPPGVSVGEHSHFNETDFYYVIKGEAVLTDNGKEIIMHAGDLAYASHGESHAIANRSDKDVEMICLIETEV